MQYTAGHHSVAQHIKEEYSVAQYSTSQHGTMQTVTHTASIHLIRRYSAVAHLIAVA